MKQFIEIMHPKPQFIDGVEIKVPRPTNEEAHALFARIVEETLGLHPWDRNTPKSLEGTHLVIGAVTWSGYDLRALDELASVAVDLERHDFRIDIFDIDRVFHEEGKEAFEKRIPGIGDFCTTPILGVWENGLQTKNSAGPLARQILTEYVKRHMGFGDHPVV